MTEIIILESAMTKILRVGVAGSGSIGGPTIDELVSGKLHPLTFGTYTSLSLYNGQEDTLSRSFDDFIEFNDIIVIAIPMPAALELTIKALIAGKPIILPVTGVLTKQEFWNAYKNSSSDLYIPRGALHRMDQLEHISDNAARVLTRSTKPPKAFSSDALHKMGFNPGAPKTLSTGEQTLVQQIEDFPNGANTMVTIAVKFNMDPLGTQAKGEMICDPHVEHNIHEVFAYNDAGHQIFYAKVDNAPTIENPTTSKDTPLSVIDALKYIADQHAPAPLIHLSGDLLHAPAA